jgi:hypothetical protein
MTVPIRAATSVTQGHFLFFFVGGPTVARVGNADDRNKTDDRVPNDTAASSPLLNYLTRWGVARSEVFFL